MMMFGNPETMQGRTLSLKAGESSGRSMAVWRCAITASADFMLPPGLTPAPITS